MAWPAVSQVQTKQTRTKSGSGPAHQNRMICGLGWQLAMLWFYLIISVFLCWEQLQYLLQFGLTFITHQHPVLHYQHDQVFLSPRCHRCQSIVYKLKISQTLCAASGRSSHSANWVYSENIDVSVNLCVSERLGAVPGEAYVFLSAAVCVTIWM